MERALCDLGARVSLMPLSLSRTLRLPDLKTTNLTIMLAYHSIRYHAGMLEDIPIQLVKFIIPCDFIVLDMDDNLQAPVILGRPFLSTMGR